MLIAYDHNLITSVPSQCYLGITYRSWRSVEKFKWMKRPTNISYTGIYGYWCRVTMWTCFLHLLNHQWILYVDIIHFYVLKNTVIRKVRGLNLTSHLQYTSYYARSETRSGYQWAMLCHRTTVEEWSFQVFYMLCDYAHVHTSQVAIAAAAVLSHGPLPTTWHPRLLLLPNFKSSLRTRGILLQARDNKAGSSPNQLNWSY